MFLIRAGEAERACILDKGDPGVTTQSLAAFVRDKRASDNESLQVYWISCSYIFTLPFTFRKTSRVFALT